MGLKPRHSKATQTLVMERKKARRLGYPVRLYREILAAKRLGLAWTPYRNFKYRWERVGAARCCRLGCNRVTNWVSYSTHMKGRTALCDKHKRAI